MSEFTERIKLLIEGLKTNPRQLSIKCGVSPSTIHRILKGSKPSFEMTAKIAKALNVSADYLLTGNVTVDYNFMKRLQDALNYAELSIKELAERVPELDESKIQSLLDGDTAVPHSSLENLTDTLGVSRFWLISGTGDMVLSDNESNTDYLRPGKEPVPETGIEATMGRIREVLKSKDLDDPLTLAKWTGFPEPLTRQWLSGKKLPTGQQIVGIALGVSASIDYILYGTGNPDDPNPGDEPTTIENQFRQIPATWGDDPYIHRLVSDVIADPESADELVVYLLKMKARIKKKKGKSVDLGGEK